MPFNIKSYAETDVLVRHPLIENDMHSRIIRQLSIDNSPLQYSAQNPLIIADIGCGDGQFTNHLIENIIIGKVGIQHVTKYLIDPFGNRDQNDIITLSDKEFSDAFPSDHCDIIICKSVAHFFKNFYYWLHNCCRILKPHGVLYILHMSSKINFPWGNYAQQSFELSLINEASEWENTSGPLPNYKDNTNNYGCTVVHHKFNEQIQVTPTVWRRFIANRSWSTLQSLTEKALREALKFVDVKYKNAKKVNLDLRWTLSVITKNAAKLKNNYQKIQDVKKTLSKL